MSHNREGGVPAMGLDPRDPAPSQITISRQLIALPPARTADATKRSGEDPMTALLLRIAEGELVLQAEGLTWSNGSRVTPKENEQLRELWRQGDLISLPASVGVTVTLQPAGLDAVKALRLITHRAVEELRVFGESPEPPETNWDDEEDEPRWKFGKRVPRGSEL